MSQKASQPRAREVARKAFAARGYPRGRDARAFSPATVEEYEELQSLKRSRFGE